MSNRSYPADFSRPLREVPVATEADVQRMLERLRRRCKVGKTSSQQAHEEARPRAELSFDLAPASSADTPTSAGGSHVSATAEKTACAGGGFNGSGGDSGLPFQPTRPAPDIASGPAGQEAGEVRGVPPAGKTPVLQWERVSPIAMRTTCGTWTCCKVIVRGLPQYELWRKVAGVERPIRLPRAYESFLKAQETAQAEMDVD